MKVTRSPGPAQRAVPRGGPARGFTLIELISSMVIIGVLAATVIPRFTDFREAAINTSLDNYASSLQSAMSLNAAGCQVTNNVPKAGKCITVNNCIDGASLISPALPSVIPGIDNSHFYINHGYISASNGVTVACGIELVINTVPPVVYTRSFQGTSAGN